jgi:endoglucanase
MAGAPFHVDDHTAAADAERAARDAGRTADADALHVIAGTPQSVWFIAGDDAASPYVRGFFGRAATEPGRIAAITLHGLPQQVCAGDNAPGAESADRYRAWIDGYAQAIADRRAVVFLEPDALAASGCLSPADRAVRLDLVAYAVRTLSALPHAGVYIDAGAGDWRKEQAMAALLRRADVREARGFTLNTTHYDWTADEVAYGLRLSRLLHGKHFVVNPAFNGRGPQIVGRRYHVWCNPTGRALGPTPTTRTHDPRADAFFWLGNPGLSDGRCNGGPRVGTFWEPWALDLVRNAAQAPDFPVFRRRR